MRSRALTVPREDYPTLAIPLRHQRIEARRSHTLRLLSGNAVLPRTQYFHGRSRMVPYEPLVTGLPPFSNEWPENQQCRSIVPITTFGQSVDPSNVLLSTTYDV